METLYHWKSFFYHQISQASRKKKEFTAAAFNLGHDTFIIYIAFLESPSQEGNVHPSRKALIAALMANEAPISIPTKYYDFADVFSPELALKLSKHTGIYDHAIKLVDDWQPSYGPIYSLGLVELEILKTYIETNLANGFIRPSKSPARAHIFLIRSQIDVSKFVLIIGNLTTSQSRTNIHYPWFENS